MSKLEKWYRLEEEAREVRRRSADWGFIETLPPKLRAALKYCIETGDLYVASRIAGPTVEEFNELRKSRYPQCRLNASL